MVCVRLYSDRIYGDLVDSPEGKMEWIPDEKLTSLNLWQSDPIFFPWIEEEKFFSAKFEYDGDVIREYKVAFHSWKSELSFFDKTKNPSGEGCESDRHSL